MKVAQKRNAVQEGLFYFRKDIFKGVCEKKSFNCTIMGGECLDKRSWYILYCLPTGCIPGLDGTATAHNGVETDGDGEDYTLMSIDTIINGKVSTALHLVMLQLLKPCNNRCLFHHQEGVFQGLIPILNCYLENMEVDVDTRCTILNYLKLIKKRASGMLVLHTKGGIVYDFQLECQQQRL